MSDIAVGVLTRTLLDAPLTQNILPVSGPGRWQGVLRVGLSNVALYKLSTDGGLDLVADLLHLPERILSACLADQQVSHLSPQIKDESGLNPNITRSPPAIFLTLESGYIAVVEFDIGVRQLYIVQTVALPRSFDPLERVGRHIAVHPNGRAVAVAASERGIFVVDSVSATAPHVHEKPDGVAGSAALQLRPQVDDSGHVLKMAFLNTQTDLPDVMVFLLIKIIGRKLNIQRYDWSTNSRAAAPHAHAPQRIHLGGVLPDLLIPIGTSASFVIAASTGLYFYRDLLCGHADLEMIVTPDLASTKESADYPFPWTAFARLAGQESAGESLFIARADGLVLLLDAQKKMEGQATPRVHAIGRLPCALTAMTVLPAAHHGCLGVIVVESLVAKMLLSKDHQNGIYQLDFEPLQALQTCGTGIDLVSSRLERFGDKDVRTQDGLFVTSTKTPGDDIVELRHGLEANLAYAFEHGIRRPTTRIWPFAQPGNSHAAFIISDGADCDSGLTSLVTFDDDGVNIVASGDLSEPGISGLGKLLQGNTVLLTHDPASGELLHVTDSGFCRIRSDYTIAKDPRTVADNISDPIRSAEVVSAGRSSILVSLQAKIGSISDQSNCILYAEDLNRQAEPGATIIRPIADAVSALAAFQYNGRPMAAMWLVTGCLEIYSLDSAWTFVGSIRDPSTRTRESSCTAIVVASDVASRSAYIFCGFRDGTVKVYQLLYLGEDSESPSTSSGEQDPHLRTCLRYVETLTLGVTEVLITSFVSSNEDNDIVAIAACGSDIYAIRVSAESGSSCLVMPVYLVDHDDPQFAQGSVTAITQIQHDLYIEDTNLRGTVAILEAERFLIAQISSHGARAMARALLAPAPGPSRSVLRLMYSRYLSSFVVGINERSHGSTNTPPSSVWRSLLEFRGAGDRSLQGFGAVLSPTQFYLQADERIYAMTEWSYSEETGRKWVFILVATGFAQSTANGSGRGRIHMIQPSVRRKRVIDAIRAVTLKFEDSVFAICLSGNTGLVVGHGRTLSLYQYDPEIRKWTHVTSTNLLSPAVSIDTSDGLIYVGTARDSLMIFRIEEPNEQATKRTSAEFILVATDSIQAASLSHLTVPMSHALQDNRPALTFLSTKHSELRCLLTSSHSPQRLDELCSIVLPHSLTKLRAHNVSASPVSPHNTIIGTSTDGALTSITAIDAKTWSKLKYIEELIRRNPLLSPFEPRHLRTATIRSSGHPPPAEEPSLDIWQLPLGLRGLDRYPAETDVGYESRTGLGPEVWSDALAALRSSTDTTRAADEDLNMDGLEYTSRLPTAPSVQDEPASHSPQLSEDGWPLLPLLRRPGRWAEQGSMHVDGDVLGRLLDVRRMGDTEARARLADALKAEAGGDRGDRIAIFVRGRLEEELELVDEAVRDVRRALKSWGFW